MPIYEFRCQECGTEFEELVSAGTGSTTCPQCGAPGAKRVYSAQARTPRLAKSPGAARKQEARNAQLHASAKAKFKERRRRAREARSGQRGTS